MPGINVLFTFHAGISRRLFQNVRLTGSWDATGKYSSQWSQTAMAATADGTGCDAFSSTVILDATQVGTTFQWGVIADLPGSPNAWAIVTETPDPNSTQLTRSFVLGAAAGAEDYWFATGRRLGAQKYTPQGATKPGIRFAVWAPNAQTVEVVFAPFNTAAGTPTGYISDDGTGIDSSAPVLPMTQIGNDGVWETNISSSADLADFGKYMNRLYMFRIQNEQGNTTYKVDIFSRNQAGRGQNDPSGAHYPGSYLSGRHCELFGGIRSRSSDQRLRRHGNRKTQPDA